MREISSEIEIEASPEAVWNVLVDIGNWAEWNPIIADASGDLRIGAKLAIRMKGENNSEGPAYSPVLTAFQKPELIRWRAKMMAEFLFRNDKILELQRTDKGTKLMHKELFKGLLVPVFWSKMESGVPDMLDRMNQACKEKVESKR